MNAIHRRDFINKTALAALGGMGLSNSAWANNGPKTMSTQFENASPNAAQKAWMDLGFGMFVHFGINTYYDKEWSDGTLDISAVNPTKLDTDQWCRIAKAAGMKYIVLVAKHHDGFCNWPSRLTNYSIGHTPYKKDIVGALANSTQKFGLKLGLYYSLWDRHEKSHDTDIATYVNDFMLPQLEELMTGYGEIVELWFDGFWKYQKNGWTKKNQSLDGEAEKLERDMQRDLDFMQAWRNEGAYWWQMDHVYQTIKKWQPNCLVMNNSTSAYPGVPLFPVDIRSGEKYTTVAQDQKIWNWLGKDIYLPLQIETTMSVKGNEQFKSGNWFWHEWDHSVASKETIRNYLDVSRNMQANLLLNVGPSDKGLLRPEDEKVLSGLRG
jgi:alpha-L-fucosidase